MPVEQVTATPVETAIHRPQVQSVESPMAVVQAARTTTVVETSQRGSEVVTETAPVTENALMEETAPATEQVAVAHQPAVMPRESATQSDSPVVEEKTVQHRVVQYRKVQADYGWLRDTLWNRIQELKRYPALARSNHWEGKVVVAAVIREDGTVVGLRIAESSGRPILDQEALSVMRQASPLTLKHPLGKPQVTILIPISYRLDG
ncbi:MAG: energy transducer TonB [Nitrospira sp.]|nr:energy transducer TonB [Nitrospira sp.]